MNNNNIKSESPLHATQISEYELSDLFRPEGTVLFGPTPIQIEERTLKYAYERLSVIAEQLPQVNSVKQVDEHFTNLISQLSNLQNTSLNADAQIVNILAQIRMKDITRAQISDFLVQSLLPTLKARLQELDAMKK